jgi:serine/threonine protein kinase
MMLTATFPFRGKNEKELFAKIGCAQFNIPGHLNFDAKHIVNKMLNPDPKRRATAVDCC